MKTISKSELIERINEVKGTTIVSIDVVTEPRMRKTDNPYLGAMKTVSLSGVINFDYENTVNKQLQREGKEPEFKAQERAWGVHEGNWITHKGEYYMQVKVQGASEPVYYYKGCELPKTALQPFLQESSKPHTQESVEKEVVVRDVKLSNIKVIRALGDEYLVVQ